LYDKGSQGEAKGYVVECVWFLVGGVGEDRCWDAYFEWWSHDCGAIVIESLGFDLRIGMSAILERLMNFDVNRKLRAL
jgi:hypothetical protein